jgi:rRNA maturation endonuclease Nob1
MSERTCFLCDTIIANDKLFCDSCGNRIDKESDDKASANQSNKNKIK